MIETVFSLDGEEVEPGTEEGKDGEESSEEETPSGGTEARLGDGDEEDGQQEGEEKA